MAKPVLVNQGMPDTPSLNLNARVCLRPKTELEEPRLQRRSKTLKQLTRQRRIGRSWPRCNGESRYHLRHSCLHCSRCRSATHPHERVVSEKLPSQFSSIFLTRTLLVLSRKWIASGAIPPWVGLWPVHIAVLILVIYLLIKRVGWAWFIQRGRNRSMIFGILDRYIGRSILTTSMLVLVNLGCIGRYIWIYQRVR